MLKFLLPSVGIFFSALQSLAQLQPTTAIQVEDVYELQAVVRNAASYDGSGCGSDPTHILYAGAKIRVKQIDNGSVIFIVVKNLVAQGTDNADDVARINNRYCISEVNFRNSVVPNTVKYFIKPEFAIITLPFKFNTVTYVLNPGGTLGVGGGVKYVPSARNPEFSVSGLFAAGASSIPLNNNAVPVDESQIKLVGGVGIGGGVVIHYQNFQTGLLYGSDYYNAGSGPENNTWISFSVGFSFTAPKS